MATIFSKIISGEIPSYKIAEDDKHYAFLDIRPLAVGHTLVVPKKEVDYVFDLSDAELGELVVFAKKIALAMDSVIDCKRIGLTIVGLEVPHTHIHLIPINTVSDMEFSKGPVTLSENEMRSIADKISSALKD